MKELLIRGHLGLGDGLAINAIIRHFSKTHAVTTLCKPHNAPTLAFMLRDLDSHTLIDMPDDATTDAAVKEVERHGKQVLKLGMYGDRSKYEADRWDESMFKQAGLDHKDRWNFFGCARQESRELEPVAGKYAFVHDDAERGFVIPPESLPLKRTRVIRPDKKLRNRQGDPCILFDYWGWLDGAEEIHCIDSCFAIMVDHLHLEKFGNKRLVLHLGLRGETEKPPARLKGWEIVRHNRI